MICNARFDFEKNDASEWYTTTEAKKTGAHTSLKTVTDNLNAQNEKKKDEYEGD